MKVFCIGLGKTGTTSFGSCMQTLGFKHCQGPTLEGLALGQMGGVEELTALIEANDSFDDFPWPYHYGELADRYPQALFVLTRRKDAETWYRSLLKHAQRRGGSETNLLAYGCHHPKGQGERLKALYERHNQEVRDFFAGSESLLEVCWDEGDGWERLCSFLGVATPKEPFPHANSASALSPSTAIERLCKRGQFGAAVSLAEQQPAGQAESLYVIIRRYIHGTPKYRDKLDQRMLCRLATGWRRKKGR